MERHLATIAGSLVGFKYFEAEEATKGALEAGVPREEITKTLMALFREALERYEMGKYSIDHLTASASIFDVAFNLAKATVAPKGKVALASMIIARLPLQRATIGLLHMRGLRDKAKVIVGGAVTSDRWAAEIGADGWAPDAPQAIEEANRLLRELRDGA
jgi:methanogenic corrinoid protein MtbC1